MPLHPCRSMSAAEHNPPECPSSTEAPRASAVPVLPGAPARAASLPALPVERMRARAAVGQQVGPAASLRA